MVQSVRLRSSNTHHTAVSRLRLLRLFLARGLLRRVTVTVICVSLSVSVFVHAESRIQYSRYDGNTEGSGYAKRNDMIRPES